MWTEKPQLNVLQASIQGKSEENIMLKYSLHNKISFKLS